MAKPLKEQMAEIIRDTTHNLIVTEDSELDNEIYFDRLKYFIGMLEGYRKDAYLDGIEKPTNRAEYISVRQFNTFSEEKQKEERRKYKEKTGKWPIVTVGIVANLEIDGILDRFDRILGEPGLMQLIYSGKANLTDEQVAIIFRDCIEERFYRLRNIYKSSWNNLRVNEQITIISLYFNLPALADGRTSFYKHIKNYVETGDVRYLKLAVHEVEKRSNPDKNNGIQNRRDAEGALLASYNSPTYTKPHESLDSAKLTTAELNKTIVPLNNDYPITGINSDYFIWRTKMDNNVRAEHAKKEGKIYRKDNPPGKLPGEDYNCRCNAEEVPDYIVIKDTTTINKAFELYMCTGIKYSILLRTITT